MSYGAGECSDVIPDTIIVWEILYATWWRRIVGGPTV